jgi:hypothetical protein
MAPKKQQKPTGPTAQEIREKAEEFALREHYNNFKVAMRKFKDSQGGKAAPEPRLKHFAASAAEDSRVFKSFDAVYSIFKRTRASGAVDPVAIPGRPSKQPDALQLHAFSKAADSIVILNFDF